MGKIWCKQLFMYKEQIPLLLAGPASPLLCGPGTRTLYTQRPQVVVNTLSGTTLAGWDFSLSFNVDTAKLGGWAYILNMPGLVTAAYSSSQGLIFKFPWKSGWLALPRSVTASGKNKVILSGKTAVSITLEVNGVAFVVAGPAEPWIQPDGLTSNTAYGRVRSYALNSSTHKFEDSSSAYWVVQGGPAGSAGNWGWNYSPKPALWTWTLPEKIQINGLTLYNGGTDGYSRCIYAYSAYSVRQLEERQTENRLGVFGSDMRQLVDEGYGLVQDSTTPTTISVPGAVTDTISLQCTLDWSDYAADPKDMMNYVANINPYRSGITRLVISANRWVGPEAISCGALELVQPWQILNEVSAVKL